MNTRGKSLLSGNVYCGHCGARLALYDTASIEAKKMIVSSLIRRVDVYRGYKLHIEFTIDFEQFCRGLDFEAVAA